MVASWSLNFIVGKFGLRHMSALTLAAFRVELAALILLSLYAMASLRLGKSASAPGAPASPAPSPLQDAPKFRPAARDWGTFAKLGFFGVAVNQVCFTAGLAYTSVGHASLIIGMGPVFVLLLARLRNLEVLTARKILGMSAALVGAAVLGAEKGISLHSATLRGDLIMLCGSIGFSVYTVFSKEVAGDYEPIAMNTFNFLLGGLMVLPVAIYEAARVSQGPGWASLTWQGWGAILFMALFSSVISYLIYFWALHFVAASRLAMLSFVQPVLTTLMGVAWLGEHFTRSLLIGGALILFGLYIIEFGPREPSLSPSSP
jgi:drug/metabolite transporter (DMT)-like permease